MAKPDIWSIVVAAVPALVLAGISWGVLSARTDHLEATARRVEQAQASIETRVRAIETTAAERGAQLKAAAEEVRRVVDALVRRGGSDLLRGLGSGSDR